MQIIVCLGLAIAAAQEPVNFQELQDQGNKAASGRDALGAEKAFRAGLDAATVAGDRKWTARFAESMGRLFAVQNDFPKAVEFLARAQEAFLEASEPTSAATTLDTLGQLQARLGRLDDAEKSLNQASKLLEAAGDAKRLAKIRSSQTDLYFRRSDFRAALEIGFRALDDNEKIEDHRETAKVLENLGNTFQRMGQPDNALVYHRRALVIREKYAIKQDLPFSYRTIGAALAQLGRDAEALEYYKKSLELGKAANSAREIVSSSIDIGSSEQRLGHKDLARQSFEEALAVAEQRGFKPQAALCLYNLGNLFLALNDLDHALDFHQRALAIREGGDPRVLAMSLSRIGLVLENRGDLKGAEQAQSRAISVFEKLGVGITDPVQYGAYRETSAVLYPYYARVLMKLGRNREALLISERSRGVGLARMIALNAANFIDLLSPDDAKTWQGVTARLARASNALRALEEKADSEARLKAKGRAVYVQTERELSDLRDRLFASTAKLRATQLRAQPSAEQLEGLAKKSPDTLFLEWMMVDAKSSLLFALSQSGLQAYSLDAGSPEIQAASNAWRLSLVASIDDPATVSTDEPQRAQRLYQLLFAKVKPLLEDKRYSRLVLVPEGPLLDVAFPALVEDAAKKDARLTDRFAISNTVSFSYLWDPPSRKEPTRSLLSIADPIPAGGQRVVIPSNDRYDALSGALNEARAVARLFPGAVTLAGPAATEADVKRRLGEFKVLHFATHGILDQADGLRSGLLLAAESGNSPDNGVLEAWEIAGMSLNARLAVLSACGTARGKEQLGDGLIGLAWAFQAAGVPRVVASLWNVDDNATSLLITSFYEAVQKGERVDDAMKSAMLKTRKDSRYKAPYYWSAFEILGLSNAF